MLPSSAISQISVKIMCNDTCQITGDPEYRPTESGRDLVLVWTLEEKHSPTIFARKTILVWPKAVLRTLDLMKTERRKPKGGKALQLKRIRNILKRGKPDPGTVKATTIPELMIKTAQMAYVAGLNRPELETQFRTIVNEIFTTLGTSSTQIPTK